MTDTYTCAMCGGTFKKGTPEEEAVAELHEMFGEDVTVEECSIVCDNCWQKVRPDRNTEIFDKWKEVRS